MGELSEKKQKLSNLVWIYAGLVSKNGVNYAIIQIKNKLVIRCESGIISIDRMCKTKIKQTTAKLFFLLFAVGLIVYLTCQNSSDSSALSAKVTKWINGLFGCSLSGKTVRHLAHIPEFLLLAAAAQLALKKEKLAFLFCVLCSFGDEFLKTFVPTRHFDVIDLCFDFLGYGICLLLILLMKKKNHLKYRK